VTGVQTCALPIFLWFDRYSQALLEHPEYDPNAERARQWIHAGLLSKDSWLEKQKFDWPVVAFGNVKQKQTRVAEVDLLPIVNKSWGMLSAAHVDPGNGWWRVRFAITAATGAVMFGDNREMFTIYGPGNFFRFIGEAERASAGELVSMAQKQKDALLKQAMSRDELQTTITTALQEI
jgi:hypothetical protein